MLQELNKIFYVIYSTGKPLTTRYIHVPRKGRVIRKGIVVYMQII